MTRDTRFGLLRKRFGLTGPTSGRDLESPAEARDGAGVPAAMAAG